MSTNYFDYAADYTFTMFNALLFNEEHSLTKKPILSTGDAHSIVSEMTSAVHFDIRKECFGCGIESAGLYRPSKSKKCL